MAHNSVSEKPILEKVFDILSTGKQPRTFYELIDEVVDEKLKGKDRPEYLARLYTNMNLDGRFLSIGENFWGLRAWYPVEQRTEEAAAKIATKRKRRKADDDYGFDGYEEDFDLDDDLDVDLYDEDADSDEGDDEEDIFDDENEDSFDDNDDEFVDDDDDDDEELDDEDDEDEELEDDEDLGDEDEDEEDKH